MGLQNDPQPKMINMMYLVLTALLALNVSAEILNAFKTVNRSITNANNVLKQNNDIIYSSFKEKLIDPKTKVKAEEWSPKADQAHMLTKKVYDDIEGLKEKIKAAAGYKPGSKDSTGYESNL